jgi:hypothetical protein
MLMTAATARVHIRFEGRSEDLDLAELGLAPGASDAELTAAVARRYGRPAEALADYVVAREAEALIVRPIAYYG